MLPRSKVSLDELVRLAQSKRAEQRGILFESIADLFLAENSRLTERERALSRGILDRLLHQVEMEVRRALAERLADIDGAPHELVSLLANDRIEIARPILLRSKALRDPDLVEIVRQRGKEHSLVVAMRPGLSTDVTDVIVAQGDEDVIERLLQNQDAELSRRAVEYLVAESERFDRFQEPLVARKDLPPELAARMYWWVSAALRQYLVKSMTASELDIDEVVEDTTEELTSRLDEEVGSLDNAAAQLVERLAERDELNSSMLTRFLRAGRVSAFIAGLSRCSRLATPVMRQILLEEGGESLAILCKAIDWPRAHYSEAYLLSRKYGGDTLVRPAVLEANLRFYDELKPETARSMLRFWRRDRRYIAAIDGLAEGPAGAPASADGGALLAPET